MLLKIDLNRQMFLKSNKILHKRITKPTKAKRIRNADKENADNIIDPIDCKYFQPKIKENETVCLETNQSFGIGDIKDIFMNQEDFTLKNAFVPETSNVLPEQMNKVPIVVKNSVFLRINRFKGVQTLESHMTDNWNLNVPQKQFKKNDLFIRVLKKRSSFYEEDIHKDIFFQKEIQFY